MIMSDTVDKDKVIRGLECCSYEVCPKDEVCPYQDKHFPGSCQIRLHIDALKLLKEYDD